MKSITNIHICMHKTLGYGLMLNTLPRQRQYACGRMSVLLFSTHRQPVHGYLPANRKRKRIELSAIWIKYETFCMLRCVVSYNETKALLTPHIHIRRKFYTYSFGNLDEWKKKFPFFFPKIDGIGKKVTFWLLAFLDFLTKFGIEQLLIRAHSTWPVSTQFFFFLHFRGKWPNNRLAS